MKKAILIILSIFVLYLVSIFALPSVSSYIGEKVGLTEFNSGVIKARDEVNEFFSSFDIIGKYKDTKDSALEIKQNLEIQVQDTKVKIEEIQTKVDETGKAIDETTKAINNTVNTINDLGNSISNIVGGTGETQQMQETSTENK
ncbi:MAG: hypothetical protein AB7E37_03755 [Candidatus Altimarinota bacterium]